MIYPRSLAMLARPATVSSMAAALLFLAPSAAWAVYPQKVELVGDGAEEIPTASIRFEASDGSTVLVERDDDDGRALALIFPGDRSVSGELILSLPDGSIARIAIPVVRANERIVIDLPGRTARIIADRSNPVGPNEQPRVTISFFGGAMDAEMPGVGAGTQVAGGSEDFAALLDDNLVIPFGGAAVAFDVGGGSLELFGGYGEGDDQARSSIPSGGPTDVAISFTDFSPGASTGLFLGNAGLDTTINRQVEILKFGGVYTLPIGNPNQANGQINGRIGAEYKRVNQDIEAFVMSPTFGMDVTSNYLQRSTDENISLIMGAEYRQQSVGGFYFAIGADGMLIHRDADLDSDQAIICMICAAPDDAFTISVTDSNNGVTFGGRAHAEVGFNVGSRVSIGVLGFAEYIDEITQIANPRTGDDLFIRNQPTAIGTRSATNLGGAVVLRIGM